MSDEVVKNVHLGRDRVTVSFSRKYNVAQYESVDIHIGLSSDRKSGEEISQTFDRVEQVVDSEFEKLCTQVEGKHGKEAPAEKYKKRGKK